MELFAFLATAVIMMAGIIFMEIRFAQINANENGTDVSADIKRILKKQGAKDIHYQDG